MCIGSCLIVMTLMNEAGCSLQHRAVAAFYFYLILLFVIEGLLCEVEQISRSPPWMSSNVILHYLIPGITNCTAN